MHIKNTNEAYKELINQINLNLEKGDYFVFEDGNEYRMTVNGLFLKMKKFGGGWIVQYHLKCGDKIELLVSAE